MAAEGGIFFPNPQGGYIQKIFRPGGVYPLTAPYSRPLVLTNSFTGLLHNTYFQFKSIPIVNTMDDIIDNQEISVLSNINNLNLFINSTNNEEYKIKLEKIRDRVKATELEYKDEILDILNPSIFQKLVNGEIIYFCEQDYRKQLFKKYEKFEKLFSLSTYKYLFQIVSFSVYKNNPLYDTMIFL